MRTLGFLVLMLGLGATLWLAWRRQDPVVVVDFGVLIAAPDMAEAQRWERGSHRCRIGQRLRSVEAAVLLSDRLRWSLAPGSELVLGHRGWELLGGAAEVEAQAQSHLFLPLATEVVLSPQTTAVITVQAGRSDLRVQRGSLEVQRGHRVVCAVGEGALVTADRLVRRSARHIDGYVEDFEEPDWRPLEAGWVAGMVIPIQRAASSRALAAVAEHGRERVCFRSPSAAVAKLRVCHLDLLVAAGTDAITVTWLDESGHPLGGQTLPVVPGWQEVQVTATEADGTALPLGVRLGGWLIEADQGRGPDSAFQVDAAHLMP